MYNISNDIVNKIRLFLGGNSLFIVVENDVNTAAFYKQMI